MKKKKDQIRTDLRKYCFAEIKLTVHVGPKKIIHVPIRPFIECRYPVPLPGYNSLCYPQTKNKT